MSSLFNTHQTVGILWKESEPDEVGGNVYKINNMICFCSIKVSSVTRSFLGVFLQMIQITSKSRLFESFRQENDKEYHVVFSNISVILSLLPVLNCTCVNVCMLTLRNRTTFERLYSPININYLPKHTNFVQLVKDILDYVRLLLHRL